MELEGPLEALGLFTVELSTFMAILHNITTYLIITLTFPPSKLLGKGSQDEGDHESKEA